MNTLKPLLIVAVLAGIGYGVYVRINKGNDAPPPGVAQGWDALPQVQLPAAAAPSGPGGWSQGAIGSHPGVAQPFPPVQAPLAGAQPPRANEIAPYNPQVPSADAVPYSAPAAAPVAPPYNPSAMPANVPPYNPTAIGPVQGAPGTGAAPPASDPAASAQPFVQEPIPVDPAQANPYANAPPQDPAGPVPPGGVAAGVPPYNETMPNDPSATVGAGVPPGGGAASPFATALEAVRRELEAGQLAPALKQLSSWYEDPRLSPIEKQQLNQLLDQVAGTVVYSTQHLLEAPYEVQPGERLEDIAQRYNIPWQLLAKINGIDDPQSLRAGERLKVMRGPFAAVVSLEKKQLTLLLADGSYAGRFNIGLGRDHPPAEGVYAVSDKVVNPVYRGRDRSISGGDPGNPLGGRWIGLGTELGIHGTNRPDTIGRNDLPGSISLSPRDAEDVYDILSVGSKVIVRR